ncbi:splicing factor, Prp19-binding domain-containing protein [Globomyces pollinis-pini]|nr:splicing factor, Prp19-binding domain-containing protein [Globomyces pollinis-pini]
MSQRNIPKPTIYRRGIIPEGVQESNSSDSEDEQPVEIEQPKVLTPAERRLQRLAQQNTEKSIKTKQTNDSDDSEDEKRKKLKERALQRRREDEMETKINSESIKSNESDIESKSIKNRVKEPIKKIESETESESTSESESEPEDLYPTRVLLKPVFIPKVSRETIIEQERLKQEALKAEELRLQQLQERKQESSEMVLQVLRDEIAEAERALETIELDDTDEIDIEAETAAWKLRELLRIKRDRQARDMQLVDTDDIERRRAMTDNQIQRENIDDGKLGVEKEKYRFLQKYYHKGAFYVEDDKVREALKNSNEAAPTLEDKADKTVLPEILQVKNFGKAGRTKYTHLVDQDTTDYSFEAAWSKSETFTPAIRKKMGGMKSGFDNPLKKHKSK